MSNMNNITTELGVEKFPVGGRIGVAIGIMAAIVLLALLLRTGVVSCGRRLDRHAQPQPASAPRTSERKIAERSMPIKNMIEDLGSPGEEPIPSKNVSEAVLDKISEAILRKVLEAILRKVLE